MYLVIGGAGYIGSHIVNKLRTLNKKIVVLDNLSTGVRERIPKECEFICENGDNSVAIKNVINNFKIKKVIMLAHFKHARESIENPTKYWDNNISTTLALGKALQDTEVESVLLSSSCSVYGDIPTLPSLDQLKPISPYGRTKLASEWILSDILDRAKINLSILRYFNVIGAGDFPLSSDSSTHCVVPNFFQKMILNLPINIYGNDFETEDGTAVRDYVDVEDLTEAHISVLEQTESKLKCEIFDVSTGVPVSVKQIADCIKSHLNSKSMYNYLPRNSADPAKIYANPSNNLLNLGWRPKSNYEHSISRHIESCLRNGT